jgi:hypothetical protein
MKFRFGFVLLFILFFLSSSKAQEVVQGITGAEVQHLDPIPGWNIHVGYSYAVIDNHYEILEQYKSGLGLGAVYRWGQWFSLEGVFTRYKNHNALSLDNIQAWTVDLNGQLSMRIAQSDLYFRIIFGGGYVDWKGYFVGPNLNDNYHYYKGKLLKDQFGTCNLGWGFAHYFYGQRLEGFGDFRMRFAADRKVLFSICDTQINMGLRYSLSSGDKDDGKSSSASRKTNREKKRKQYKWLKNRQ